MSNISILSYSKQLQFGYFCFLYLQNIEIKQQSLFYAKDCNVSENKEKIYC